MIGLPLWFINLYRPRSIHTMTLIPSEGDSRGIELLIVTAVFVALAAVAVFFRVWSRRIQKHALCFNDYSIFVALVQHPFEMWQANEQWHSYIHRVSWVRLSRLSPSVGLPIHLVPWAHFLNKCAEVVLGGLGQHQENVTLAMTENLNKASSSLHF